MTEVADDLTDIRSFGGVRGPKCGMGLLLDGSDESLRDALIAAMEDQTIAATAISRWLKTRKGISIAADTVRRHRSGDCACG